MSTPGRIEYIGPVCREVQTSSVGEIRIVDVDVGRKVDDESLELAGATGVGFPLPSCESSSPFSTLEP